MAMTGGTAKCVKTTYPFSDKSKAVKLYVYYKSSQDISENKSMVSCGMYVTTPSGWDIGPWGDWEAQSYVGTTGKTFDGSIPNFSGTRWLCENKSFTVTHEADGTGKATIYWKWAVNSSWGGYVNPSGKLTVDLPTIPRATTPKLEVQTAQMGKSLKIKMNRYSPDFTHTLKYKINGTTDTIASDLGISYTWKIPKSLVQYIPDKTSATVTIICETYLGNEKIGSKTVNFTATVPSASVPTVSTSSVQMGKSVTISTNREVSYYTHTLKYTLGGTTKSIKKGAGASFKWTVPDLAALINNATSGKAVITCETYNGTAKVGTKTVDLEIQVYDASTVSFSSDNVEMGTAVKITVNRGSSNFKHKLTYEAGTKSGTINSGVATSQAWTVPKSLMTEYRNVLGGGIVITCETYNGTAFVGSIEEILTIHIPGASIPSISPEIPVMGEDVIIHSNAKWSDYTHRLYFVLGNKSVYAGTMGEELSTKLPLELASEIPNNKEADITLQCITYNGTQEVGEEEITFTATVPDNETTKPSFTMTFTPEHSLSSKFDNIYVQGKSKVNVTFDAKSEYADIKSYSITVNGATSTGNPAVSGVIYTNGEVIVAGTVTDSRGYSRTIKKSITVCSYSKPKLTAYQGENNIICTRSTGDKQRSPYGEYVLIRAIASYSKVQLNGVAYNDCFISYRYKAAGADTYPQNWKDFPHNRLNNVLLEEIFNIKTAYTVQLKVDDEVGEYRIYTFPIADFSIPLHLGEGGKNAAIGQFCDYSEEYRFDIGWTTYFNTGIGKKVIFEASDDTTGWEEGTVLDTIFPDSDISLVDKYTMFLAIVSSTDGESTVNYPVPCFRSGNRIYGQFTVNIISSGNIRSYALYMTYAEETEGASSLTLQKARYITHINDGAHGSVGILGNDGTADKQMVTALYALI